MNVLSKCAGSNGHNRGSGTDDRGRAGIARDARHSSVPIVDAAGKLVGQFNFDVVLSNLLPGPITVEAHGLMDANLRLDYLVDAEDHVARRLGELLPVKLTEVMDQEVHVVHPDTPLWEGIRQLFQHGSPIAVVDEETGKLLGLLSVQSVMGELAKLVG